MIPVFFGSSPFRQDVNSTVGAELPAHIDGLEIPYYKMQGEQLLHFRFGGEIECCPDRGQTVFPTPAELGILFREADGEVERSRVQDIVDILYIGCPVFREDMVQQFPVIGKVKCFLYFMQVAK